MAALQQLLLQNYKCQKCDNCDNGEDNGGNGNDNGDGDWTSVGDQLSLRVLVSCSFYNGLSTFNGDLLRVPISGMTAWCRIPTNISTIVMVTITIIW